ncbi:hypothetical protein DWW90_20200 [Parabacteroides sp. AF17-28]|nr:hypothetical protein DWW90_20200 [Parabacteroides sp. AF17-28]
MIGRQGLPRTGQCYDTYDKSPLSPRMTRGRKRTGLINQLFIRLVLMRSRVKRGNRAVLTHPLFCKIKPVLRIATVSRRIAP